MSELVVLDVAHGSCVLLVGERTVVFDAGPGSALLEYLAETGIESLEAVYLSHADSDHIKGLIALLGSGAAAVKNVFLNSDANKGSELWVDLQYELDDYRRRGEVDVSVGLTEGHVCPAVSKGIDATVVAPRHRVAALGPGAEDRSGARITTNTISAVVRVSKNGQPVALLAGDLDAVGLRHLLEAGADISAPLLVFPHHGGHCRKGASPAENVAFAAEIMNAVRPQVVAFSIGRGQYATPRPEIIGVVRAHGNGVRVTCTQLSERCSATLPREEPSHLVARFSSGRERGRCCAGTLVVDLDDSVGSMLPAYSDHQAFIDFNAATALCRQERGGGVQELPAVGERNR